MSAPAEPQAPPARAATVNAGWYRDPLARRSVRYWDGESWTGIAGRRRFWDGRLAYALATLLVAVPGAIWLGWFAATESGPGPLDVPSLAAAPGDAEAKALLRDLAHAIDSFYAMADASNEVPVIAETGQSYTFISEGWELFDWEPPVIPVHEGVELVGQVGDSASTWCVGVTAPGGDVKDWSATRSGIHEGPCGE